MRHFDFQRIHDEFVNYYKNPMEGDSEYYDWLKALSLDEAKPYGQAKERFQWARDMIKAIGEDLENKYYKVLVAFPLESMNGNVYREADLKEDAKRITQGHPSINHKDEFWLSSENPNNKWGTVDITGAEYEDGAVEALLKVPKSTLCPVCSETRKPLYQMIDEKRIINVSLEGYNSTDGHFIFDQKTPFTLLTSNILPGIPLARIKPLEKIMVEALQVSTGNKKIKIVAKVKEASATSVQPQVDVNTGSITDPNFKGTLETPVDADAKVDTQNDLAKTVTGGSVADNYKMQSGYLNRGTPAHVAKAEAVGECPGDQMWDETAGKCVPKMTPPADMMNKEANAPQFSGDQPTTGGNTDMPKPEDIRGGPTRTQPPQRITPTAGPWPASTQPQTTRGTAPVGAGGVVTGASPHENLNSETLAEKVLRFKAEDKARNLEEQVVEWQKRYTDTNEQLIRTNGRVEELKLQVEQANGRMENAFRDMHAAQIEREKYESMRNDAAGERDEYQRKFESLKRDYDGLNTKYQNGLQTNLGLSQKLTAANEDYLDLAKKLTNTEEALGRARNEAKRITKITA